MRSVPCPLRYAAYALMPTAGNGKTLRTERAMKAFVKNWITMSGPSSAKAGMQGTLASLHRRGRAGAEHCPPPSHRQLRQQQREQLHLRRGMRLPPQTLTAPLVSHSAARSQMIDELTDGDGSNRTE